MSSGGTISKKDIIIKSISKGYFNKEDIVFVENNESVIETVQLLKDKGFLNDDRIFSIMQEFSAGSELPIYEQLEDFAFLENPSNANISKNIINIFNESINKFGFYDKSLTIYGIDIPNKALYAAIPFLSQEYIEVLKDFKQKSEYINNEQKYLVETEGGIMKEYSIKLDDFKIKISLSHQKAIQRINQRNSIEKSMVETMNALGEEAERLGTGNNDVIEKYELSEANGKIEGALKELFLYGLKIDGSDLHFEPYLHSEEGAGRIRYRAQGTLNNIIPLESGGIFNKLIRTLKEISGMKVDISNVPQDGKIDIIVRDGDRVIELPYRVNVMPIGEKGQEKAVLRMLSKDTSYLNKKALKMDEDYIKIIDDIVGDKKEGKTGKYHTGMILMTGPTGSGKSTSLFAILNGLNVPDVNIITLEDPIEYELFGLNQSHIKDGNSKDANAEGKYTFGSGIRACMRQDPDIILIGEIRDPITLDAAVEAASTGHMVFASLHTNNTWETLDRLLGLGLELRIVSATIRLILAQRLAQFVCPECAVKYEDFPCDIEEKERRKKESIRRKKEVASALMDTPYVRFLPDNVEEIPILQGTGCPQCGNKGIAGRTSIMELLPIDLEIQDFLVEFGVEASKIKVAELYRKKGIITLYQTAMKKVLVPIGGKYLNFDSALVASGGNVFDMGKEYTEIIDLVEFNEIIKAKKAHYHNSQIELNIRNIEIYIKSLKANITDGNKVKVLKDIEEKEKEIKKLKSELVIIGEQKVEKRTKEIIKKEIEELKKGVTKENKQDRINAIQKLKEEYSKL